MEKFPTLPAVPESETWVLGSILTEPWRLDEVAVLLRPSDFSVEENGIVYQAISEMYSAEKAIDAVSLSRHLERNQRLNKLTEGNVMALLIKVAQECPLPAHAVWHATEVRRASVKRGIILACEAAATEGYTSDCPPAELLAKVEAKLISVQDERVSECLCHASEVANDWMGELNRRMSGEKGPSGVPTGFVDLDSILTTLRPGELTILAARPGMGKTSLAANIAEHAVISYSTPTLFVSLEMNRLELMERVLSGRAEVPLRTLRSPMGMAKEDRAAVVAAVGELGQGALWIDDSPGKTLLQISSEARRLKRKSKLGLLIIDYLQLIEPEDPRMPREQQVATISRRLKRLARELQIPVICLAQLNRQNESKPNKRPTLSNLRESGAIEQDADVVMFIHREEYYLQPKEVESSGLKGQAEVNVAKHRNGRTGVANLVWREDFTQFVNAAKIGREWNPDEWNPRD